MIPVIAIVGRPNVGKSTLFNRIARRKKAIVGDEPGITRDRNYAEVQRDGRSFLLIDTGGFEPGVNDEMSLHIYQQVQLAMEEADLIIFLVDGKEGLTPADIEIANKLREVNKPVLHVINKIDGDSHEEKVYDFYRLGIENLYSISAEHGRGVGDLMNDVLDLLPKHSEIKYSESIIKIAVIGRPNVGKSSLVNRIIGNERGIVSEKPGTTRDAIDTPFKIGEKDYILIDTAGIRRRGRISRQLEKYSVIGALKSISRCDVALILIDAEEGITEQDAKIAGLAHDKGRASVLVVNKWDLVEKDTYTILKYTEDIRYNLKFLRYAPIIFVSALTGQRALKILDLVDKVAEQYQSRVPTSELNRVFEDIKRDNPPPRYRNRELKLYYITQVSIKPPSFVIFVNFPEGIHFSYERYITNKIRENFGFEGTPVRVFFRKRS
ncbi:MAG: ribosome biogenesis GTPase Der [Pseudomonadota bacterium]